jgi:hypothetical protein
MSIRRGPEWLFPDRRRCIVCHHYFGFEVLERLYCSVSCARTVVPGYTHPSTRPQDAPRTCRVWRDGAWVWKHRYTTRKAARRKATREGLHVYRCPNCGVFHLSKRSAPYEETESTA